MLKRKANDIENAGHSMSIAVSSIEPRFQEASWNECLKRLAVARNHLSQEDSVLATITMLSGNAVTFDSEAKKAADEADEACARLLKQVEEATETCKQESQNLKQLKALLNKYRVEQNMLSQQIQECNDTYHELRQQTERFKVEASEDMDNVEHLKEKQFMEVTRLRHQISLYALCSGIKWDYSEEGILAGEVVSAKRAFAIAFSWFSTKSSTLYTQDIGSKGIIRCFSIDPNEYSRYEIANKLTSIIEGAAVA